MGYQVSDYFTYVTNKCLENALHVCSCFFFFCCKFSNSSQHHLFYKTILWKICLKFKQTHATKSEKVEQEILKLCIFDAQGLTTTHTCAFGIHSIAEAFFFTWSCECHLLYVKIFKFKLPISHACVRYQPPSPIPFISSSH